MPSSSIDYVILKNKFIYLKNVIRGHSSAGRAPAWHAGGQRFESAWLHLNFSYDDKSLTQFSNNKEYIKTKKSCF